MNHARWQCMQLHSSVVDDFLSRDRCSRGQHDGVDVWDEVKGDDAEAFREAAQMPG